jgi:hypothetical protein
MKASASMKTRTDTNFAKISTRGERERERREGSKESVCTYDEGEMSKCAGA